MLIRGAARAHNTPTMLSRNGSSSRVQASRLENSRRGVPATTTWRTRTSRATASRGGTGARSLEGLRHAKRDGAVASLPGLAGRGRGLDSRPRSSVSDSIQNTDDGAGLRAGALQKIFHVIAFAQTFAVWFWHFTPLASYLPGYSYFGFFFRYLTFCTFTLQMFYLGCAVVSSCFGDKVSVRFKRVTGGLAGMAFIMSNVVTVMYYGVMQQFPSPIEGSIVDRPPFLNLSVHCFNACIGWLDLVITNNMSLSWNTNKATLVYGVVYTLWMQCIKEFTGRYPYPFLDKLPPVVGPIAIICLAFIAIAFFHTVGLKIRRKMGHPSSNAADQWF